MKAARRRPRRRLEGLSFVEGMAIVCLLGTVLMVFGMRFFAEVRTTKIAESSEQLEVLSQRVAAYYVARHRVGDSTVVHCLPEPAGPAPEQPSLRAVDFDFTADAVPGHATFRALGFHPPRGVRYRYSVTPSASGCDLDAGSVVLRAEGDLDGDGMLSRFERRLEIDGERRVLAPVDVLMVVDRVE